MRRLAAREIDGLLGLNVKMRYETICSDTRGDVSVITLNRPERLNAWTVQMGGEMRAAVEAANEDDDVNAIVLTGAGRGFCAGADVEAVFKARSDGEDVDRNGSMDDWVELIRESKPIVAAINGAAIGLGLTLALPMDYLVAAADAKLSVRFVKMGLVPELASTKFLAARVGFGRASQLMLSGATLSGSDAQSCGLVDEAVTTDDVLDRAIEVARDMGCNPHSAVREIKRLLTDNMDETDLRVIQQREGDALATCYASAEHREAVDAFLDKREPDFESARRSERA